MAEVVRMPKMSDTMTEGVIAKWHKKVGDKVNSGDLIAEVETDKATMDFESYQEGTLLYIGPKEGDAVPIDSVIAVLGEEGEDYESLIKGDAAPAEKKEEPKEESKKETKEDKTEEAAPADSGSNVTAEDLGVTVITMPLLSDTMTEGVIAQWNFKVGDTIKSDDAIADVETDKATMEVTAYADGTLLYVGLEAGQAAKVNDIIAIVGPAGTDVTPLLNQKSSAGAKSESKNEEDKPVVQESKSDAPVAASSSSSDSRIKASPLAKKIAKEKGIDLSQVKGSAENGRIVRKDVENFKPSAAPAAAASAAPAAESEAKTISLPQFVGEERFTEKPVNQMRKTIARRLSESLFTAPHFYLTISVDMDNAMAARAQINEVAPVKVSFNDIVVKAVAVALKQHPNVNSSWLGDKIRYNEHTNIGVAMAVEDGLLVPVVRFADGKSLSHISAEVKDFAQKAKAKKLQPSDWEGSTFTVSNLGMFGIDEFTSIINSPDGAILSVGAIQQVPVVKNGAVVPGNIMKLTLGCDHRVVDGATGAQFLQTLKGLIEAPIRLLA
ncbi:dihydrolipoamide acetyltransferase component of pyruvate dehydrogenase complex [Sphingobacterium mizutaii NBRC 14946 = DSM 11724]|uniref:Dihydrolipoamide acetyltransferase component of pyruvate dehydrogenase complex n=2 Tax=Sphingobacterium mizutaii TaxID=1010 RepID=A0AAJ4XEB4_9SPHI|nr:pyruvate dehydrogenase complex dihydrolipoamide acetyltransferase [Sphingobacterium mizutaii]GEM68968.1 dihydrolipoamide acetyltransferase component of pyruvate dehydrogenase complex [Sphingobacterium mizutaii NBRC 14946 = DSM 11724]SDL68399.1 pyruvate dehydrogenase E2 component (dihydrolipoamide acetyltransferase) [Sphingobacterium mizutaii]SNV58168.1 Dihydrolipoyllysine-residue acetyltransferase component of pyruvate dehydrogenase complex [Sphingobacterium mizutaii]